MTVHLLGIWAGFVLDFFLGDPQGWPHPVRVIGWLVSTLEGRLRAMFPKTRLGELAAGRELVVFVLMAVAGVSYGAMQVAGRIHPALLFVLSSIMCWWALAARCLKTESMKVCDALEAGDVESARRAVSMIVGRDTERLDADGIARAAVETVAENTSDGVVAPLFYLILFGPVMGLLYKAVNTMDSMVGYRNERYLYFGRAAAKVDDLANWVPSRLAALLMIACAWALPGYDGYGAWRVWRRDGRRHASPNSAQGEAACAGALGVMLAGDAWYFKELCHKPTIGDEVRPIAAEDIRRANRLMYASSVLGLFLLTAAYAMVHGTAV